MNTRWSRLTTHEWPNQYCHRFGSVRISPFSDSRRNEYIGEELSHKEVFSERKSNVLCWDCINNNTEVSALFFLVIQLFISFGLLTQNVFGVWKNNLPDIICRYFALNGKCRWVSLWSWLLNTQRNKFLFQSQTASLIQTGMSSLKPQNQSFLTQQKVVLDDVITFTKKHSIDLDNPCMEEPLLWFWFTSQVRQLSFFNSDGKVKISSELGPKFPEKPIQPKRKRRTTDHQRT